VFLKNNSVALKFIQKKLHIVDHRDTVELQLDLVSVHIEKQYILGEKYIGYITGVVAQAFGLQRKNAYALVCDVGRIQAQTLKLHLENRAVATSADKTRIASLALSKIEAGRDKEGICLTHSLLQIEDWEKAYALLEQASARKVNSSRLNDLSVVFDYHPKLFDYFEKTQSLTLRRPAEHYLTLLQRSALAQKTALVVMAGGEGSRMGNVCKAMLKLSGKTLLQHHINSAQLLEIPLLGVCLPGKAKHPDWHAAMQEHIFSNFGGPEHVVLTENDGLADWSEQLLKILEEVRRRGATSAILVMGDSILRQDLLTSVFANNHANAIGLFTGSGGASFVEVAHGNILSYADRVGSRFVQGAQQVVWKLDLNNLALLREARGLSNLVAWKYREWGCEYTSYSVANMNDPESYSLLKNMVFGFPHTIIGQCPSLSRAFVTEQDVRAVLLKINCLPDYLQSIQLNYKGAVWKVGVFKKAQLFKYYNQREDRDLRIARSLQFFQVTGQKAEYIPEAQVILSDFYRESSYKTLHNALFSNQRSPEALTHLATFVCTQLAWLQSAYEENKESLMPLPQPIVAEHVPIDTGALTHLEQIENTVQNLIGEYAKRNSVFVACLSMFAEILAENNAALMQWGKSLFYAHGDYSDYNVFLPVGDIATVQSGSFGPADLKDIVSRSPIIDGEYARLAPQGVDYASFVASLLERGEIDVSEIASFLAVFLRTFRITDQNAERLLLLLVGSRLVADLWFVTNVVFDLQAASRYLHLLADIMHVYFGRNIKRTVHTVERLKIPYDEQVLTYEYCGELLGESRKLLRPIMVVLQQPFTSVQVENIIKVCRNLNCNKLLVNLKASQDTLLVLQEYAERFGIRVINTLAPNKKS